VHNVDYGDVSTVVHKSLEVIGAVAGPTALGIAANAANVIYHGVEVGFGVGIGSREGANEAAIDMVTGGIGKLGKLAKTAVSVGKTVAKKVQENQGEGEKKSRGNKLDDKPATLYEKYDKDGKFQKHGITKNEDPTKRYTKKEIGGGKVVPVERGPRKEMAKKERENVETNPGPDNHEPWAGKRKNK